MLPAIPVVRPMNFQILTDTLGRLKENKASLELTETMDLRVIIAGEVFMSFNLTNPNDVDAFFDFANGILIQ